MTDLVKCPFCGRTDKMVCCTIAEADDIDAPNNFEKSHYGVVCDASIRKTLLDYEQLKADYIEIDMQLRTANTENDELKQMLRLAVDTMDNGSCSFDCQKCERLNYKGGCGYDGGFKWKNHDEAMKLLGGTESVD